MWDYSEPGAGESSEKKVKRCEMLKDFQLGLWVLEVTYHFNASSANIRSRSIYDCVGPENIQTPTTEGISLRTTPPPWIFHFCRELMAPHPSGISTSVTKTPPTPLEKFIFTKKDYYHRRMKPFMASMQPFPSEACMLLFPFIWANSQH